MWRCLLWYEMRWQLNRRIFDDLYWIYNYIECSLIKKDAQTMCKIIFTTKEKTFRIDLSAWNLFQKQ